VAGEGINGQKDYVEQQDQAADPYAESSTKKEPAKRVAPKKKDEEDEPHIKKVAMKVLQNKRKSSLASVKAKSKSAAPVTAATTGGADQ